MASGAEANYITFHYRDENNESAESSLVTHLIVEAVSHYPGLLFYAKIISYSASVFSLNHRYICSISLYLDT